VRVVDGEVEARVGGGVAERAREDVEEDILAAPRVLRKVKQREVRLGERRSEGEDIRVVGAYTILSSLLELILFFGEKTYAS